jgi:hypothetical protein
MASPPRAGTIAKTFGLDDATRSSCPGTRKLNRDPYGSLFPGFLLTFLPPQVYKENVNLERRGLGRFGDPLDPETGSVGREWEVCTYDPLFPRIVIAALS